jgi:hypothetical protein
MGERMVRWARFTGASFLTVLGACAGRYDVGDAPDGGAGAPEAGAGGSVSTGGSGVDGGTSGTGGSGVGGDTGGTGGSGVGGGTGGTGGSGVAGAAAGSSGASGSSTTGGAGGSSPTGGTGGTSGEPSCGAPTAYEYGTLEAPVVVWARMQAVLNDVTPASFPSGLPDETSPAWAASRMSAELGTARLESGAPRGTRRFMNTWLQVGDDEGAGDTAEVAARAFVAEGATFATLTMPEGERTLFEDPALNLLRKSISVRGAWMQSSLFCLEVDPPPENTLEPLPMGEGTRRQALEQATSQPVCAGCHYVIDPPGYSLEGIDPETGEPRETDNGFSIDASGVFDSQNSSFASSFAFSSITDLAPQLAVSCEVASCFVRKVTADAAMEAGLGEFTNEELAAITYEYVESGYALEVLLRAMVRTPTFLE